VDGARLALRTASFDWVCSSHLIEHFVDPGGHAGEIARVLRADGAAFFITPNAPADFENPYHVTLFEPHDLRELLGRFFDEVEVIGLDGSPAVKEDFERRRRTARRLLALDVFDLRHRLPRRWFVGMHGIARRVVYGIMGNRWSGGTTGIDAREFFLTDRIDQSTLVLFAVARRPRH
jgi:SAM-dependent methyltransferase